MKFSFDWETKVFSGMLGFLRCLWSYCPGEWGRMVQLYCPHAALLCLFYLELLFCSVCLISIIILWFFTFCRQNVASPWKLLNKYLKNTIVRWVTEFLVSTRVSATLGSTWISNIYISHRSMQGLTGIVSFSKVLGKKAPMYINTQMHIHAQRRGWNNYSNIFAFQESVNSLHSSCNFSVSLKLKN